MDESKEKAIEKRIRSEITRLKNIYAFVPKATPKDAPERAAAREKIGRLMPLIKNAAFMAITLEDLQSEISKSGTTQAYQNGENQKGIKRSAEVDIYNTMVKTLSDVIKRLDDMAKAVGGGSNTKVKDPFGAIRDRDKT